jgi:hypothetical protein
MSAGDVAATVTKLLTAAGAVITLLSSSTTPLLVIAGLVLPIVVTLAVIALVAAFTDNPKRHTRCVTVLAVVRNAAIPDPAPCDPPCPRRTPRRRPRRWRRRRAGS